MTTQRAKNFTHAAMAAAGRRRHRSRSAAAATALGAEVRCDREVQLERSIDTTETRQKYHRLYDEAEQLDVEPKRNVAAGVARSPELVVEYAALSGEVAKAKAKERAEREAKPEYGTPESVGVVGVDPRRRSRPASPAATRPIVDASGTYHGKYQFDVGTWASVGGSGLPSQAPEAEQDYRAALLYSQAGSSPWPVCGA